jgi:CHAT domain-containing protein
MSNVFGNEVQAVDMVCLDSLTRDLVPARSRHTSAHILYLACHGIHASDPLSSALVLQDGNHTFQDIMHINLPSAVMAVLSTCQTTKGRDDRDAPGQAIQAAAWMPFCSFRSVVGTMWWASRTFIK